MKTPLPASRFLRFCVVGFIGLLIDAALLECIVASGSTARFARVGSMFCALQVTYILHARFTFHAQRSWKKWRGFMLSNVSGALINYLVFLSLLHQLPVADPVLQRQLALMGGTAVGLIVNYWLNKRFVFA